MCSDIREIVEHEFVTGAPEYTDLTDDRERVESVDVGLAGSGAEFCAPITNDNPQFFYPTWRAQVPLLLSAALVSIVFVPLSRFFNLVMNSGTLFTIGESNYSMDFPFLMLLPGILIARALISLYNAKYMLNGEGVEAHVGLCSRKPRVCRLPWEDVRDVESNQTSWEQSLDIGSVLVGSAMKNDVEVVMEGVASPRSIQKMICDERDRRLNVEGMTQV